MRPLPRPGQRNAISALEPARAILLGALAISTLAGVLLIFALAAGWRPPTELLIVAVMMFPLGVGAWQFTARPLLVRRWLLGGVIVTACLLISLIAPPVTQFYVVMVAAVTITAWRLSHGRPIVRRWMDGAAIAGFYGSYLYGSWTITFLCLCCLLLLGSLRERDAARVAIEEYRAQGGQIEDLYNAASPEQRTLVGPAAVIIFVLIFTFGIAGLWSMGHSMSTTSSGSGRLGIGGGR
ncbi:hypothetical protein [Saltatorellus ferox]|uniref:hypothetical protein n=1 Tax=Saltatorellus ferox TaxID=2528018 RepID=UPI003AF3D436